MQKAESKALATIDKGTRTGVRDVVRRVIPDNAAQIVDATPCQAYFKDRNTKNRKLSELSISPVTD